MLGANKLSFVIVAVYYAISISIALSPIGEWLLRLIEGVRKIETNEEREYLEDIFEEVYQNALKEAPQLNKEIKLYIIDAMFVNAFAIGRKTIAVTTGAIETFSREELKGILAHEFGHIRYGHTKALLLSVIGNMLFSLFVLIVRVFLFVSELLAVIFAETKGGALLANFSMVILRFGFDLSIIFFMYIRQAILSLNSRSNEYQADEFAYTIGFGDELITSLYLLQKVSGSQKVSIKDRMTSSHPHIAKRIGKLEGLGTQG